MSIDTIMKEFEKLRSLVLPVEQIDELYAELMIKMEKTYEIPVVLTPDWERQNKTISTLYRLIASSRLMAT